MRIHHLNCGTMRPYAGGLVNATATSIFARGRCVIHCLLVETEAGLALVDTGWGARDYASPSGAVRLFTRIMGCICDPEETAIRQVARLGYAPSDVRHIFVTHMHLDHAGGLSLKPPSIHARSWSGGPIARSTGRTTRAGKPTTSRAMTGLGCRARRQLRLGRRRSSLSRLWGTRGGIARLPSARTRGGWCIAGMPTHITEKSIRPTPTLPPEANGLRRYCGHLPARRNPTKRKSGNCCGRMAMRFRRSARTIRTSLTGINSKARHR
jgi:hypothetical protein